MSHSNSLASRLLALGESCRCNRPGGRFPGNSEVKDQQNSVTCVSTPCTEIYMYAYCLYYIWNDVVDAAG